MYPILILDDVFGVNALLVCIPFLYWMMSMGRMLFSYVSNFILDDVYGAAALLVCIQFLY